MKKILLLLFTFCFCSFAKAQNTFEKIIDTLGCDGVLCIQETFDGGYVFSGTTTAITGGVVLITKLDSIGTIEWVKTFDGPGAEGGTYIEQLPDSGYIVNALYDGGLYSKSWLLRLDVNGDSLWTRVFSAGTGATNVYFGNSMAVLNNSIYGLTGYFQPLPFTSNSAYFIASLSNGTLVANKLYNTSPFQTGAYAIDRTFNNGFIISAWYATSTSTSDFYLIRTNAYGDTLWTRTYDNSTQDAAMSVQQTSDSGFIILGITYDTTLAPPKNNTYLIKVDSIGDTLWTKQHYSLVHVEAYSIQETSDGGYIITGRIVNGNPLNSDVYLAKTNSVGDILWTKQFGDSSADDGYFVRQTKDGGFIICGTINIPTIPKLAAYIIKTDSMGNVLTGLDNPEINNPVSFSVSPNPSFGIFTFQIKGVPKKKAELKIYNVLNQCVYSGTISIIRKETVNLHHLSNGIYIATLFYDEKTISKKIIIHK